MIIPGDAIAIFIPLLTSFCSLNPILKAGVTPEYFRQGFFDIKNPDHPLFPDYEG